MVRFDVRNIAILFLLTASAAQAQPWRGPAAVEIRVEDQKGQAVTGAQVQLQYPALNPLDGPAAVVTDNRGHVTIGGVAVTHWSNLAPCTATARIPGEASSAASIRCRTIVVAGTTGQRSATSGQSARCGKKQWSRR